MHKRTSLRHPKLRAVSRRNSLRQGIMMLPMIRIWLLMMMKTTTMRKSTETRKVKTTVLKRLESPMTNKNKGIVRRATGMKSIVLRNLPDLYSINPRT
jgi:hypothetical protein